MSGKSYKDLKSGTDVRGVAVETEDKKINLTDEAVYDIVGAFAKFLCGRTGKKKLRIAVGCDVRVSCPRIASAVKKALHDCGQDEIFCGLCSTPSMFMLLKKSDFLCDASIMITASHLPYERNGLKFFTPDGGLEGSEISEILSLAEKGAKPRKISEGEYIEKSFMDGYCDILISYVREACKSVTPLKGKKIIVDAGNGAGGFFADKVLSPLGADVSGSQFSEPDGTFPNHIPNPEDKAAIASLSAAVLKAKADLGIIFDTDVDRAGAVDCDGKEINRNRLIALCAATLLEDGKGGTIVTDSVTSDSLTEFIEKLGGKHVRFKRGYKNVIDEAVRREKAGERVPLAIETSGHAAFSDNYFLDDGAYLITRLLVTLAKQSDKGETLGSLIADLPSPAEEDEVRISFNSLSRDFRAEGNGVIEDLKAFAAKDCAATLAPVNYEGARISFKKGDGDGWLLLRMSVHDPVMPINFESNSVGGDKLMAGKLLKFLSGYPFLDLTNLINFIK